LRDLGVVDNLWITCGKLVDNYTEEGYAAKVSHKLLTSYPQVIHKLSTGFG
jgi:hypothetical protein